MYRLKQLSVLVKQSVKRIEQELTVKAKGRYFVKAEENDYLAFSNTNEVLIPEDLARKYALERFQVTLPPIFRPGVNTVVVPPSHPHDAKATIPRKICVILGHFNHGKTSLLDALINYTTEAHGGGEQQVQKTVSALVQKEKHQITQEVRTRTIQISDDLKVTLVDTPGQDVFYRMRNMGAEVADGCILVIAVDDGICEQTKESLAVLKALGLPSVVCLNKVDLLKVSKEKNLSLAAIQDHPQLKTVLADLGKQKIVKHSKKIPTSVIGSQYFGLDQLLLELKEMLTYAPGSDHPSRGHHHHNNHERSSHAVQKPYEIGGSGFVLNVSDERGQSRSLHIILRNGKVAEGDYFQCGGWCGRVQRIEIDENTRIPVASAGTGLKIYADYVETLDPKPTGECISFFDAAGGQDAKADKKKSEEARTIAFDAAQHQQNEYTADIYRCNEEILMHFNVEEIFSRTLPHGSYYGPSPAIEVRKTPREKAKAVTVHGEDAAANYRQPSSAGRTKKTIRENAELIEEEDEVAEESAEENDDKILIVLRAKTDLDVDTFLDAWDDDQEARAAQPRTRPVKTAVHVLTSGVGVIRKQDVELISSAGTNARIVGYNVRVEKVAEQLAKRLQVSIELYDNMPELLSHYFVKK